MEKNTLDNGSETVNRSSELHSHNSSATAPQDVLSQILRDGAQRMLQLAIQQEVEDYLQARSGLVDESDGKIVVRNVFLRSGKLSLDWSLSLFASRWI